MYKVGLALRALVFSVLFLPCLFSFFLFLLAYFSWPSSLKLAVVSHLFKMNQLKVNFGLLRDPSFLAVRMDLLPIALFFEFFLICLQLIHFKKV